MVLLERIASVRRYIIQFLYLFLDCLDRTNVAQFGIGKVYHRFLNILLFLGKVALGFQLYALGYTDEPVIASSSELCRIYEEMYDEHGDTLAWQYGRIYQNFVNKRLINLAGSQLVHSIKTYKKISAFQVNCC